MLTFGVIIDISEPFRFDDKDEYITKVKIVDPTFNFKALIKNPEIRFHKYVTVQIYSKRIEHCPKARFVGDILRLRRFEFCLTAKGELIAFQNSFANWMIFRGERKAVYSPFCFLNIQKNNDREITKWEQNRIEELRQWSYDFFSAHKVKFITWWTPLMEPTDEKKAIEDRLECSEVDIILRCEKTDKAQKRVEFVDHARKKYVMYLDKDPAIKKGDVIKFRCINM